MTQHQPMVFGPYKKTTNPIFNRMQWLDNVPTGAKIIVKVYEVIEDVGTGGQGVMESLSSDTMHIRGQGVRESVRFCHGKCVLEPWVDLETVQVVVSNIILTKSYFSLGGAALIRVELYNM